MAQNNTTLPTGIRAFNTVVVPGAAETEVLFIKGGDGQQLTLESIDGTTTAAAVIRVYSVAKGNATPAQIAQHDLAIGLFNKSWPGGLLGAADEVIPQNLPFKAAQNLGLIGQGGIRVTVQYIGGGTIDIGANCDRRLDGPFEK